MKGNLHQRTFFNVDNNSIRKNEMLKIFLKDKQKFDIVKSEIFIREK